MLRLIGTLHVCCGSLLLLGGAVPQYSHAVPAPAPATKMAPASEPASLAPLPPALPQPAPAEPPPPRRPSTLQALESGVLIVVSIPSQRMFVFRHGEAWDSSPVSTGKPGDETPAGVFPILQKRVDHRSNLYDNAPMPYMQRLTWGGVALHGGHLPGYPASHGCIRMPTEFARKLYAITDFDSTVVLVTKEPATSLADARTLGGGRPTASDLVLAAEQEPAAPAAERGRGAMQTIQLSASATPANAAAFWQQLVAQRPQLSDLRHEIIPATVRGQKVFRLRATGQNAHSICSGLTRAGVACMKIG
jgi:lipoprotein-anchoring transpeptidase ErfK/SrfK